MNSGPVPNLPVKRTKRVSMLTAQPQQPRRKRRVSKSGACERKPGETNVGEMERLGSLLAGGALAVLGLSRRSLSGLALAALGGSLAYRGATGRCMGYAALGISTADKKGPLTAVPAGHGVRFEKSITINKSREELFAFWRDLEKLPKIMRHLESVRNLGAGRSHWTAKAPLGATVEWDAVIHNERANELIAWRSLEDSDVDTAGSVHFLPAPGDRGTEVRVNLKYDPPAGKAGAALAKSLAKKRNRKSRKTSAASSK